MTKTELLIFEFEFFLLIFFYLTTPRRTQAIWVVPRKKNLLVENATKVVRTTDVAEIVSYHDLIS